MQRRATEIDGVQCDQVDTEEAPPEMQWAVATAAEARLELADDTDQGA